MAGFARYRAGALTVVAMLTLVMPALAQTGPMPSFDCVNADRYVEWGICHDADLARLDVAIGAQYPLLLRSLDAIAAAALRADQARFLADRDSFIGGTLKGEWVDALKPDIMAKLEE